LSFFIYKLKYLICSHKLKLQGGYYVRKYKIVIDRSELRSKYNMDSKYFQKNKIIYPAMKWPDKFVYKQYTSPYRSIQISKEETTKILQK